MSVIETNADGKMEASENDVALQINVPSRQSTEKNYKQARKHTDNVRHKKKYSHEDRQYESETKLLRHRLKIYFYAAVKYKNHVCSFQAIYFVFMLLQMLKVGLITAQMFSFGDDRVDFNNVVHRGHLTLRHLLLEGWDASWETLPYPPAQGDFAVYEIDELKKKINYAVTNLYNAPADAIGYFTFLDAENVTAEMTYFDFGGFQRTTARGLQIKTTSFKINVDEVKDNSTSDKTTPAADSTTPAADKTTTAPFTVENTTSAVRSSSLDNTTSTPVSIASPTVSAAPTAASDEAGSNDKHYMYDVDKDFERNNLSDPIKRLLTITILFRIYSVRVDINSKKARCLSINGWVHFKDPDNNGQVIQNLETLTKRTKCADLNYDIQDRELETVDTGLSVVVILLVIISMVYTVFSMGYGVFVMLKTKRYMKKYYDKFYHPEDPTERDLPIREYSRFFKGWDLIVLVADFTTIFGTFGLILELKDATWTIGSLEQYAVGLGIGCILAWVGLLRYLKFNYKFHLLFNTMYTSIWDVLAYLACITVLFVGYMSFGYVVIGPYHVKFRTPSDAATTLFALINGDEIYATFALLEADQTGGPLVPAIYQVYIGSYVAIFTIIVINLLIALFTNAYDAVKEQYENPIDHEEGPLERALKQLLTADDTSENKKLKTSICDFLKTEENQSFRFSFQENKLRTELRKTMRIKENKIILKKPRTLKAFILDEEKEDIKEGKCGCAIFCLRFWGSEGHYFC